MNSLKLLTTLRHDVQTIIETAQIDFATLPDHILQLKPSAGSWSILQCLDHLNKYSAYYLPAIKKAIQNGSASTSAAEPKSTWLGKKFIEMMHPSNAKQQKTFKRMDPSQSTVDKSVLEIFLSNQYDLLELLDRASNTNLNRAKVPVEFLKFIKMNLGDALKFVIVHEQRHIQQAIRAKSVMAQGGEAALKI